MRNGFPVELPFPNMQEVSDVQQYGPGVLSAPVLADLNGDYQLDIILTGMDGKVHVYQQDGSLLPGFPLTVSVDGAVTRIVSSPAIYDLNKDGFLDLIFGSNHTGERVGFLFAVSGKGNLAESPYIDGFPARIPVLIDDIFPVFGLGIPVSPIIGDVDQDGEVEIIIHPFAGKTYILNERGRIERSLSTKINDQTHTDESFLITAAGQPSFADVNGDDVIDPVASGLGSRAITNLILGGKRYPYDHLLGAWDGKTGKLFAGFPRVNDDLQARTAAVSLDWNGDGKDELFMGSGGYFLHGFSEEGEVQGYPKFTGGWLFGSPSLGDIDGDGLLEIAATTREGYVYVYKTGVSVENKQNWPTLNGHIHRTNTYLKGD